MGRFNPQSNSAIRNPRSAMFSMLTEGRMTVRSGVGLAALIAACASYPLNALQGQRSAPNAPQANGYITGAVQGSDREDSARSSTGVSGQLLALAARAAGAEGVSGHRA